MKYRFESLALFFIVVLLMTGCRMSVPEYEQWRGYMLREAEVLRRENAAKEDKIRELQEKKRRMEEEKAFLIGKSEVLIRENASLDKTWDGMGVESHEVMMNLFGRIHDSEMAFYDVRLGNPPQALSSTMQSEKYTLLVDMGRTVQGDCHIQMAELYRSRAVLSASQAQVRSASSS